MRRTAPFPSPRPAVFPTRRLGDDGAVGLAERCNLSRRQLHTRRRDVLLEVCAKKNGGGNQAAPAITETLQAPDERLNFEVLGRLLRAGRTIGSLSGKGAH